MKAKSAAVFVAVGLLFLGLGAGRDQVPLNNRMLIQGIGVDKAGEGYLVTVQVSEAKQGKEGQVSVFSSEGDSVLDALNNATLMMGRKPLYSHNMVVLFGRTCAEEGLYDTLDFFVRQQETRPTVSVFIAAETAGEALNVKNEKEEIIRGRDISEMSEAGRWNGKIVNVRILDVVNQLLNEGASPYIPILQKKDTSLEIAGTALFQKDKMVDVLDLNASRGLLLVLGKLQTGTAVVEVEDSGRVTLHLDRVKSKIKIHMDGEIPVFQILISCNANISAMDRSFDRGMGDEYFELIGLALRDQLEQEVYQSIDRCIQQNGADVFSFGRRLMARNTEFWHANQDKWGEWMRRCRYDVSVTAQVQHVGQEITPALN